MQLPAMECHHREVVGPEGQRFYAVRQFEPPTPPGWKYEGMRWGEWLYQHVPCPGGWWETMLRLDYVGHRESPGMSPLRRGVVFREWTRSSKDTAGRWFANGDVMNPGLVGPWWFVRESPPVDLVVVPARKRGIRGYVNVGRGTRWGNPYTVGLDGDASAAVEAYVNLMSGGRWSKDFLDALVKAPEAGTAGNLYVRIACPCNGAFSDPPTPCHAVELARMAARVTGGRVFVAAEGKLPRPDSNAGVGLL